METQQSQVKTADVASIIDYSVWKSVRCLPLVLLDSASTRLSSQGKTVMGKMIGILIFHQKRTDKPAVSFQNPKALFFCFC